jgi:DNA polymerase II small subunit/DNA polymerase delta subunit B
MKKTVGCFTEEKLNEISQQSNAVVYQPTHDIIFEPWPPSKVSKVMDDIVQITLKEDTTNIQEECNKHDLIKEFSQKYTKMYEKLTNREFVKDVENIRVLKKMIALKSALDNNLTSSQAAQAQVSDLALNSLSSRVKNSKK